MREHPFDALVELCARLRAPDGCPWDREQTLGSLKPYIIEEAYEVVEGLDGDRPDQLRGELGDLLFQIVFVAQLAHEMGLFDIDDVCRVVHAKMVRRHPHVFGETEVGDARDVVRNWEAIKRGEREQGGALDGVPRTLPALLKAMRITEKAAASGFEWPPESAALQRGVEVLSGREDGAGTGEGGELGRDRARLVGDLLFGIADRARAQGVDAESALQEANRRFMGAFEAHEQAKRAQAAGPVAEPPREPDPKPR